MTQHAALLRALHDRGLILTNAWDALSARTLQHAGGPAIGTTSAGIAFALGFPDGQIASRDTLLAALERGFAFEPCRPQHPRNPKSGFG